MSDLGQPVSLNDDQVEEVVDRVTEHVRDRRKSPAPVDGFEALSREQAKQLLEFFMYRLGGAKVDCQRELAATLPQAYNAWYGRDIVKVVSINDPAHEWNA